MELSDHMCTVYHIVYLYTLMPSVLVTGNNPVNWDTVSRSKACHILVAKQKLKFKESFLHTEMLTQRIFIYTGEFLKTECLPQQRSFLH